jgi:BMFP domain-containing protein YqiC
MITTDTSGKWVPIDVAQKIFQELQELKARIAELEAQVYGGKTY